MGGGEGDGGKQGIEAGAVLEQKLELDFQPRPSGFSGEGVEDQEARANVQATGASASGGLVVSGRGWKKDACLPHAILNHPWV